MCWLWKWFKNAITVKYILEKLPPPEREIYWTAYGRKVLSMLPAEDCKPFIDWIEESTKIGSSIIVTYMLDPEMIIKQWQLHKESRGTSDAKSLE